MKKIGIVSYNIHCNFTNYGSALQSWALSTVINKICNNKCESILIDYCPDSLAKMNPLNPIENMWDKDEESKKLCELNLPVIRENYYKFMHFYNEKFHKTRKTYTSKNFNSVINDEKINGFVCGSDTIFCIDEFGFDDGYYANYECMKDGYTISYAASFGDCKFDNNSYLTLNKLLKNFKAISLRENSMIDYVSKNTAVEVKRVLDPTLLLDEKDYSVITAPKLENDKYLLLYSRRKNDKMSEFAEKIAKEKNLKVIEISLQINNKDKHRMLYEAGVEEFLSLVKHSEFIVTNSYHGMIFSVIFKKQFVIFSREQCNTKICELLDLFDLKDRLLVNGNEKYNQEINYNIVYDNIKNLKFKSIQYLKENLEKCR